MFIDGTAIGPCFAVPNLRFFYFGFHAQSMGEGGLCGVRVYPSFEECRADNQATPDFVPLRGGPGFRAYVGNFSAGVTVVAAKFLCYETDNTLIDRLFLSADETSF